MADAFAKALKGLRSLPVLLRAAATLAGLALWTYGASGSAIAYQFKDLYPLCAKTGCPDGSQPAGALVASASGSIFGAALAGGSDGRGSLFELTPDATHDVWTESFPDELCSLAKCADGVGFAALSVGATGPVYAVVGGGGAHCVEGSPQGCGAVVSLVQNNATHLWTRTVLYSFCKVAGCEDGAEPRGPLFVGGEGVLFGTTARGGAFGGGTVFRLDNVNGVWVETLLHNFCTQANCADGANPQGRLIRDALGNLYGTTLSGGSANSGTVYEITKSTHVVLYSFCSDFQCLGGGTPHGGVIFVGGTLYGTTSTNGGKGLGTAYELSILKGVWTDTPIYTFCSKSHCADGAQPMDGLVANSGGSLFGTTLSGGANGDYSGTAFQLTKQGQSWKQTVLYSFCAKPACADGVTPSSGLTLDAAGNLYGVAAGGGAHLNGVVFELVN